MKNGNMIKKMHMERNKMRYMSRFIEPTAKPWKNVNRKKYRENILLFNNSVMSFWYNKTQYDIYKDSVHDYIHEKAISGTVRYYNK